MFKDFVIITVSYIHKHLFNDNPTMPLNFSKFSQKMEIYMKFHILIKKT